MAQQGRFTIAEKQEFYEKVHMIAIPSGLPCTSGWDAGDDAQCLNVATVARFEYDQAQGCWLVHATCQTCIEHLLHQYEGGTS